MAKGKAAAPAATGVIAKTRVTHNGIDYMPGETIEDITEDQTSALRVVGAVEATTEETAAE